MTSNDLNRMIEVYSHTIYAIWFHADSLLAHILLRYAQFIYDIFFSQISQIYLLNDDYKFCVDVKSHQLDVLSYVYTICL